MIESTTTGAELPPVPGHSQRDGLERIAELEEQLLRHKEFLLQTLAWIKSQQSLSPWQRLTACYRWPNRLLPPGSRCQALVAAFFRAFARLARLVTRPPVIELRSVNDDYARWIAENEPSAADLAKQRQTRFENEPTLCLVAHVAGEPVEQVREMLRSVLGQTYGKWELWLSEARESPTGVPGLLEQLRVSDGR